MVGAYIWYQYQRMYPYQFDKYIDEVRTFNKKCIFIL